MLSLVRRRSAKPRAFQGWVAGAALLVAVVLAASGLAVFRSSRPAGGSVWHLVFSDRATIGFVRLAAVALSLYVIVSSAALIAGGRWLRGLSSSGLQVDDVHASVETVEELKARARTAEQTRDEAVRMAREVARWLNQT